MEHTTINASANIASSKGSALDILSTSSSVSVQNNEISIRGNKNILVLMDGIPTTVTDLSSIPAANIRNIDIISTTLNRYMKQTRNIIDIFIEPSLSRTYKISEKQDLSLAFSRRIGRPTYPQLNPYMSMVDAMTYEKGNMYLHPEKSSKFDLSYNVKGEKFNLFADAYLNYTTDYISQVTEVVDSLLITTYINAAYDMKSGLDISLRIFPVKWMTATLSANTFYVKTSGRFKKVYYDLELSNKKLNIDNEGWSNNSNILIDILPSKTTDIQIQYFIMTPQYYPQLTTSFTHKMNVGVKQKLLKGAMTLSLLVTDVFDTYTWEVHSFNTVYDLTNTSRQKSRMLWLGISYNFNSYKQKKSDKAAETDRGLIKFGL